MATHRVSGKPLLVSPYIILISKGEEPFSAAGDHFALPAPRPCFLKPLPTTLTPYFSKNDLCNDHEQLIMVVGTKYQRWHETCSRAHYKDDPALQ